MKFLSMESLLTFSPLENANFETMTPVLKKKKCEAKNTKIENDFNNSVQKDLESFKSNFNLESAEAFKSSNEEKILKLEKEIDAHKKEIKSFVSELANYPKLFDDQISKLSVNIADKFEAIESSFEARLKDVATELNQNMQPKSETFGNTAPPLKVQSNPYFLSKDAADAFQIRLNLG